MVASCTPINILSNYELENEKKRINEVSVFLEVMTALYRANVGGNLKKGPSFHFLVVLTF